MMVCIYVYVVILNILLQNRKCLGMFLKVKVEGRKGSNRENLRQLSKYFLNHF